MQKQPGIPTAASAGAADAKKPSGARSPMDDACDELIIAVLAFSSIYKTQKYKQDAAVGKLKTYIDLDQKAAEAEMAKFERSYDEVLEEHDGALARGVTRNASGPFTARIEANAAIDQLVENEDSAAMSRVASKKFEYIWRTLKEIRQTVDDADQTYCVKVGIPKMDNYVADLDRLILANPKYLEIARSCGADLPVVAPAASISAAAAEVGDEAPPSSQPPIGGTTPRAGIK